jgi:hypothetical protein
VKILRHARFPPPVDGLLRVLSEVGFFERSSLIGSWVMLPYQELYGVRYPLRTLDVDFAIHLAHPQKEMRADLEQLIIALGFVSFMAAEGVQKYSAKGYEVEFIAHRPGGKGIGALTVREWNINALPLPFVSILTGFTQRVQVQGFTICIPVPEAFFIHKLIVAPRRMTLEKREKDLEQCAALISVLDDKRLRELMQAQRLGKATKRSLAQSCHTIGFPLQRIFL